MQPKIYLISGLGADERVFKNLDFKNFEPHFIKWIEPFKNDTLESYAQRLSTVITTEKPIIIGASFGGMVAVEIAKIKNCHRVIIISSAKNKYDIPFLYRFLGVLKIHYYIPSFLFKSANFISYRLFGVQSKEDTILFKSILKDTDIYFLKWAMTAISLWKNEEVNKNIIHIHGTDDKILPLSKIHDINFTIKNGGHLMILNKANDINALLNRLITDYYQTDY